MSPISEKDTIYEHSLSAKAYYEEEKKALNKNGTT
jgi:hypothetical protein